MGGITGHCDLPVQGVPVIIRLKTGKWRCRAANCVRSIFTERLPDLAAPRARQTDAIAEILTVMGHGAGGETSRRLLARLGIMVSGDTVLRHLKRGAQSGPQGRGLRIIGVDEWAWRKGAACGTILVDLETRTVVDLLPDRSSASLATWLSQHPGVEIVCRDRHGLYAEGARVGAPQARQVADRFHLVQNLRDRVAADPKPTSPMRFHASLQELMRRGLRKSAGCSTKQKSSAIRAPSGTWRATSPT
jgi:transposase